MVEKGIPGFNEKSHTHWFIVAQLRHTVCNLKAMSLAQAESRGMMVTWEDMRAGHNEIREVSGESGKIKISEIKW